MRHEGQVYVGAAGRILSNFGTIRMHFPPVPGLAAGMHANQPCVNSISFVPFGVARIPRQITGESRLSLSSCAKAQVNRVFGEVGTGHGKRSLFSYMLFTSPAATARVVAKGHKEPHRSSLASDLH